MGDKDELSRLVASGILASKYCITAGIFNPEAGDPYAEDTMTNELLLACPERYQYNSMIYNGFGTKGIWNLLLQQPVQRRRQVAESLVPELRKAVPRGMRNLITVEYFLEASLMDMAFKLSHLPVYNVWRKYCTTVLDSPFQ